MNTNRIVNLGRAVLTSVRTGQFDALLKEYRRRFSSEWTHYGLSRDLRQPFDAPPAKISISVRTLQERDIPFLLSMEAPGISDRGPYVRMHRLNFLNQNIGTCYVAVTEDDTPCYMQWLIGAEQNDAIRHYFEGIFPVLAKEEALLEFAFTPERFQGKGIMPRAMALIAEKATDMGASHVITFVDHQNIPALKGCKRAGFSPYLTRTDRWRWFRRRVAFAPLPSGPPNLPEGKESALAIGLEPDASRHKE